MTDPVPVADTLAFIGAFAAAFLMTFLIIPWLIPKLKAKGITGKDLNKPDHPEIAEMGGIAVVIGFFAGVSVLLALDGVTNEEIAEHLALGRARGGVHRDDRRPIRPEAESEGVLPVPARAAARGGARPDDRDLPYLGERATSGVDDPRGARSQSPARRTRGTCSRGSTGSGPASGSSCPAP